MTEVTESMVNAAIAARDITKNRGLGTYAQMSAAIDAAIEQQKKDQRRRREIELRRRVEAIRRVLAEWKKDVERDSER